VGAVATIDTQGAARRLEIDRMRTQMERLSYLAEKTPWFSLGPGGQKENGTCRYIRDHIYPLLDDRQKWMVTAGKAHYKRAMKKLDEPDGLLIRMNLLDSLLERMQSMGSQSLEGEAARSWQILMMEAEALVLKKRGTAGLRLFVEMGHDECLCVAEKSLQAAVERWKALQSQCNDHAKALYWLALVKYGRGKDEETAECARQCMEICSGKGEELSWLQDKAKDVLLHAMLEINRDRLTR
jgi:hypothetical protein